MYEHEVGATYLAAMVCGRSAPGADGTVTEVRFQQRNAGHILDDLVVVFDKGGSTHKLSLQIIGVQANVIHFPGLEVKSY